MKYVDDILYLLGWVSIIAVGFSYDIRIGGIVLGIGFFITSWIFARYKSQQGRNK